MIRLPHNPGVMNSYRVHLDDAFLGVVEKVSTGGWIGFYYGRSGAPLVKVLRGIAVPGVMAGWGTRKEAVADMVSFHELQKLLAQRESK